MQRKEVSQVLSRHYYSNCDSGVTCEQSLWFECSCSASKDDTFKWEWQCSWIRQWISGIGIEESWYGPLCGLSVLVSVAWLKFAVINLILKMSFSTVLKVPSLVGLRTNRRSLCQVRHVPVHLPSTQQTFTCYDGALFSKCFGQHTSRRIILVCTPRRKYAGKLPERDRVLMICAFLGSG